jgi:GT2 family glycosyltransferase
VGITTRDRLESLTRCLESLACARHLIDDVRVYDDGSREPVEQTLPLGLRSTVSIVRDGVSRGPCVGRNLLVEEARHPWVLLLDDDTRLLDAESINLARRVLESDRRVGVVAFAQAEADGRPWDARMQPSPASDPRVVRSFIGFGHLVRRDVFRALGGYREVLGFYGEEKEFCLRLLEAGYAVVYLPDARIAHLPDPSGRDRRRYLRLVSRNDCLNALLNDSLPRLLWTLPGRMALYLWMRSRWGIKDPGGLRWLIGELLRARADIRRLRRPISASTMQRWRQLGTLGEAYVPISTPRSSS